MKNTFLVAGAILASAVVAYSQPSAGSVKPSNKKDSTSYAIGANIGSRLAQDGIEINADMVAAGFRDTYLGKGLLTAEQIGKLIAAFQEEMSAKMEAKKTEAAAGNKAASETVLAENKKKPGVMTTPSGLQYKVITEGKGAKPTAASSVKVHYKGTLIDGTVFDSSIDRGEPITFPLGNVIKGWTEGVQLMSVGSKYQFFIPSALAYGSNGAGGTIGPDQALIFEVELLGIEAPAK